MKTVSLSRLGEAAGPIIHTGPLPWLKLTLPIILIQHCLKGFACIKIILKWKFYGRFPVVKDIRSVLFQNDFC